MVGVLGMTVEPFTQERRWITIKQLGKRDNMLKEGGRGGVGEQPGIDYNPIYMGLSIQLLNDRIQILSLFYLLTHPARGGTLIVSEGEEVLIFCVDKFIA